MPKPVHSALPIFKRGDLWDYHKRKCWVVVTTNIGWKTDGTNVMGAGVAKEAARRFPALPSWYGYLCKKYKDDVGICLYNPGGLILLPTKKLNKAKPHLSWQADSDLDLIEQSLQQLVACVDDERIKQVVMGYPGCGNGGLQRAQAKPLLKQYLDNRFIVLRPE